MYFQFNMQYTKEQEKLSSHNRTRTNEPHNPPTINHRPSQGALPDIEFDQWVPKISFSFFRINIILFKSLSFTPLS